MYVAVTVTLIHIVSILISLHLNQVSDLRLATTKSIMNAFDRSQDAFLIILLVLIHSSMLKLFVDIFGIDTGAIKPGSENLQLTYDRQSASMPVAASVTSPFDGVRSSSGNTNVTEKDTHFV